MTLVLPRPDRHADRVFDVVRGGYRDEANDVVARSWTRCLNEYRLHPDRPRELRVVPATSLDERLARLADVIDCARYEMTTLYQQLGDSESGGGADRHRRRDHPHGVVARVCGRGRARWACAPVRCGAKPKPAPTAWAPAWPRARPVAVRREDHFFTQFTGLTCSAVPVYDPAGDLCAVLDVSSRSTLMQQHLLVLLGMTARMIENRLIDQRFRSAHPLHFHSRPEFVYTLHEGRLAVSEDGHILAANRSALFQLGLTSVAEIRSRRIEDLFQSSLEDMVQRSSSSSFHPIVTYRANAAHRFFAVARRPAESRRQRGRATGPGQAHPGGCRWWCRRWGRMPGARTAAPGHPAPHRHGGHLCRPAPVGCTGHGTPRDCAPDAHPAVWRNRLRQGGVRPRGARWQPACGGGLRGHQLRQPAGEPDRGGAVRLPGRRLHRRPACRPARQDFASRWRHLVPGRNWRHAAGPASPAAAGAGRAAGDAAGCGRTHNVDFQLVSASHRNLLSLVEEGRFRKTCTTAWPVWSWACRPCASAPTSANSSAACWRPKGGQIPA